MICKFTNNLLYVMFGKKHIKNKKSITVLFIYIYLGNILPEITKNIFKMPATIRVFNEINKYEIVHKITMVFCL